MNWKGLVLAGGTGSRLFPLTHQFNKHLLPVYDKPMIYYPLTTLMLAGRTEFVIVSDPVSLPQFERFLGDGSQWGLSIEYAEQLKPGGIAEGLLVAEEKLRGADIALILGDNIFYGSGLPAVLRKSLSESKGATVFCVDVADPSSFGVVELAPDLRPVRIVEKPKQFISRNAVVGLYLYPADVMGIAANLKPSARGELEITDVNRAYLEQDRLTVRPLGRGVAWLDGGTTDNLFNAAQYVKLIEERMGLKIGCPEEVAWRLGLITREQTESLVGRMPNSSYRAYLDGLLAGAQ